MSLTTQRLGGALVSALGLVPLAMFKVEVLGAQA